MGITDHIVEEFFQIPRAFRRVCLNAIVAIENHIAVFEYFIGKNGVVEFGPGSDGLTVEAMYEYDELARGRRLSRPIGHGSIRTAPPGTFCLDSGFELVVALHGTNLALAQQRVLSIVFVAVNVVK